MTRTFFIKSRTVLLLTLLVAGLSLPLLSMAQTGVNPPQGSTGVRPPQGSTNLQNPLNVDSFPELVKRIFQAALLILIPIGILFLVVAGAKFPLAQGNPTKLEAARKGFIGTLIGLFIILTPVVIINIVLNTLCTVDVRGLDQCN